MAKSRTFIGVGKIVSPSHRKMLDMLRPGQTVTLFAENASVISAALSRVDLKDAKQFVQQRVFVVNSNTCETIQAWLVTRIS